MRFSDTMLGGVLIAFAVALAGYSWSFPAIPGQQYGAATFPLIIAAGFAGCGILLLARGISAGGPLVTRAEWTHLPGAVVGVLVTVAVVVAYILFARQVGFIPMMVVMLIILFRLLNVPWWQTIVLALAATLVIDFVFRSVLLVPLPNGIMPRLPW